MNAATTVETISPRRRRFFGGVAMTLAAARLLAPRRAWAQPTEEAGAQSRPATSRESPHGAQAD